MKLKAFTLSLLTAVTASQFVMPEAHADLARFLVSDQDAIQARVDIIQQAKKEIFVEYFSVWNDDQSIGGIALLIQAARRGVKVKVILDSLSSKVPLPLYTSLLEQGRGKDGQQNIEIKLYNPISPNLLNLTHRDHAKMLIIDGQILLTGGRNVGDKYFGVNTRRNFNDLDILLKGDTAQAARQNFLETWESPMVRPPYLTVYSDENRDPVACAYKEDYENCLIRQKYVQDKINFQEDRLVKIFQEILRIDKDDLVTSNTGEDWFKEAYNVPNTRFMSHGTKTLVNKKTAFLNADLLEILRSTQKEVTIVSPYLIPTPIVLKTLKELKSRGVKIVLLTNSINSTDNMFAQAGYRHSKEDLIKLGAEIYEYKGPNTIHGKTALVDRRQVLIGTYNMDPRSGFLNREMGISLIDDTNSGLAAEHQEILEHFLSKSILVAKDGQEYNLDIQKEGVSPVKRKLMKSLTFIIPLIKGQL